MTFEQCLLLSILILSVSGNLWAKARQTSVCELQQIPESFVNTQVELRAIIIVGGEGAYIVDGKCKFIFASGDDYQTFGHQYRVKKDAQWIRMREILGRTECANNARAVRAKITGKVVRIPATGTIPPNEMGLELVIEAVADVSRVLIKCTPLRGRNGVRYPLDFRKDAVGFTG